MPVVIASRPDGVGTRLLTLLHAYRFSQHMGWPFQLHWPDLTDQNYGDTHLLSSEKALDYFPSGRVFEDDAAVTLASRDFNTGQRVYQFSGSVPLTGKTKQEVVDLTQGYDIFLYDLPENIVLHELDRSEERRELRKNWRRLNFPVDVVRACEDITRELHWKETISVHVRRGDVIKMLTNGPLEHLKREGIVQLFQRYAAFDTIVAKMTEHIGGMKGVIVCSEDAEMAQRLNHVFPQLCIVRNDRHFPDDVNKSTLVDLILLTKSRFVICPPISYFSFCASEASLTTRLRMKLDPENLLPELIALLDAASPPDIVARKEIVYGQASRSL